MIYVGLCEHIVERVLLRVDRRPENRTVCGIIRTWTLLQSDNIPFDHSSLQNRRYETVEWLSFSLYYTALFHHIQW